MLGNWSTTAACTSPRHTEREIQSKGRRPATRLAAPVLTSTGRTQQRHQEHNHQRQDLHIHFCTPLWLSASHSLIYCSGVCVWMGGSERERGREGEQLSEQERERDCLLPVCVCERSECVSWWECVCVRVVAPWLCLCICLNTYLCISVWQRHSKTEGASLSELSHGGVWTWISSFLLSKKRQREFSGAVNALKVSLRVCLSVCLCACLCVCVSLLFALDKETSWSCGLCIIDSVGHGKAPLAPSSPTISTPFPQTCKCTRLMKEKEREKREGGEGGAGRWRVCGGGHMQVYDNTQTDALVEKSLNCKKGCLPGIHKSKYQLIRGSRWKKGRCEMRFMLSCFCISASCIALSSSYYSLPWQSCLAKGTA